MKNTWLSQMHQPGYIPRHPDIPMDSPAVASMFPLRHSEQSEESPTAAQSLK
ncbi:hypothetical protein [Legionella cardiaca]|uniref:Uncharacterized protein n=1 Tax=Legionella cardiaca TaxID=1071983 RepID=A0ABY8AUW1_9GAMM|nr:hypothetical protein [Legionella cardiaca]WED43946.1 hypothetical protein PXX05_03950 [Legionella cardiaca]